MKNLDGLKCFFVCCLSTLPFISYFVFLLQFFWKLNNDQHAHVFLGTLYHLFCNMKLDLSLPMFLGLKHSHVHYNITNILVLVVVLSLQVCYHLCKNRLTQNISSFQFPKLPLTVQLFNMLLDYFFSLSVCKFPPILNSSQDLFQIILPHFLLP